MSEKDLIIKACDDIVDSYHAAMHDIETLLKMRRELAVNMYRLSAFVKETYGQAGLSYAQRKYKTAYTMMVNKDEDPKLAQGANETKAEASQQVMEARTAEVWADAEREALRVKVDMGKQVLQAMQQELANEAYEKRTTHFQNAQTTGK